MTNISQTPTASQSYHQSTSEGLIETINHKVKCFITAFAPVSRNEIQRGLGLTSRQTTCSTWHLIQSGVVKVHGTKEDSVTKRTVETLHINPFPEMAFPKVSDKDKLKQIRELCEQTKAYQEILPYTSVLEMVEDIKTILNK